MPHPLDEKRTPEAPAIPNQFFQPRREQHGCLVIWLIGMVLFGVYSAYLWTTLMPELEGSYEPFLLYAVLGVMLLEIFAAVGVLMRKRLSIYILAAALIASLILRGVMGILDEGSLAVVAFSAAILWGFVRPNWRYYT